MPEDKAGTKFVMPKTASGKAIPIFLLIIAALTIVAIWQYAFNRHMEMLSHSKENQAEHFAEAFQSFYQSLSHAADVMVGTHEINQLLNSGASVNRDVGKNVSPYRGSLRSRYSPHHRHPRLCPSGFQYCAVARFP